MVDASVSNTDRETCTGSSPVRGTGRINAFILSVSLHAAMRASFFLPVCPETIVSVLREQKPSDAKPRAMSNLFEYCRGAKEEDEAKEEDDKVKTKVTNPPLSFLPFAVRRPVL